MKEVTIEKYNIKIWIFSMAVISSAILLLLISHFSNHPIKLFLNENDGFFFQDCIQELANWNAATYTLENSIYHTAFPCLIFHVLASPFGKEIQTAIEIINSQQIMTIIISFFGIVIFVFFWLLNVKLSHLTLAERFILPISLMVTGPFIYWISRGNLIFISLLCCYCYLIGYNNDKMSLRVVSYVFLGVAVGLSVYPIIFGIMTIRSRKKEAVFLAIISILIFGLPYIKYGGSTQFIAGLKTLLFDPYMPQYEGKNDYNLSYIVNSLTNLLFGKDVNSIVMFLLGIFLCVLIFVCGKEKWKKIFACSLFLIMFSRPSPYYNLLFMYLPLLFFLEDERRNGDGIYLFSFIIMFIPYFGTNINFNHDNSFYSCNIITIFGTALICLTIIGGKYVFKVTEKKVC